MSNRDGSIPGDTTPSTFSHRWRWFASPAAARNNDGESDRDFDSLLAVETKSAAPAPAAPAPAAHEEARAGWQVETKSLKNLDGAKDASPSKKTSPEKASRDATPGDSSGVMGRFASEEQREPAYRAELLELFRHRLRLVTALTMAALPIFTLLHVTLSSGVENMLLATYGGLFFICMATRALAQRITQLHHMRLLSLLGYSLFCLCSGLVVSLMGGSQVFILGGHNHIVLSVLLLPYSMWECLIIGLIAIAALAWSGWWALVPQQSHLYFSHLFVLCMTTLWVVIIARFQSVLHRRAFDTAFDLGRSAVRLRTLSFLDSLTGGFNRRYLETVLDSEIARAVRFERPLSLMMFDLDNFKTVNDTRGHPAGDEVLREVWNATLATIREVDTAARYGGDEFSIVLPETDEADARAIAGRLQETTRDTLHQRFGADSREGSVTLSIGIITARPQDTIDCQTLLERADQRLYAAKRNGKNNIAD